MIMDERLEFGDALALNTGAAGTYFIGDVIDLRAGGVGPVTTDIGNGEPIYFVAQVAVAATSGGSATLQLVVASDAQATITTNGTETRHWISPAAIPVASLVAGFVIAVVELPPFPSLYERFLGILQITGTAAFTAGSIDAFLTRDVARWRAYADATN